LAIKGETKTGLLTIEIYLIAVLKIKIRRFIGVGCLLSLLGVHELNCCRDV